jgi:N-ethylmaleimide reductase
MSQEHNTPLLSPVQLGRLQLQNRIVMAPLTRSRADAGAVPHASAPLYYAQRASAGLIVSEGVCISPQAVGHPGVPGIWHDAQVDGWRRVTDAVHARDGRIVLQLWHTGRSSHSSVLPEGAMPVGPSAIAVEGTTFTAQGLLPFETPRELSLDEIKETIRQYGRGAERALAAGFDGVEIHGANGYLIDQFLHASSNRRDDDYGGTVEKRCRFLSEVVAQVTAAVGADLVGLRLSPSSSFGDMDDPDPAALYGYVLAGLEGSGLAYLHIVEPGISGAETATAGPVSIDSAWCRERWAGGLIGAGDYTRETGEEAVRDGRVDAVAFGRALLANPDLPERFAQRAPLNAPERATFYGGDDRGYLDYPSLEAQTLLEELRRRIRDGEAHVVPSIETLGAHTSVDTWPLAWSVQRLRAEDGIGLERPELAIPTLDAAIDARAVLQLGVAWIVSGQVEDETASILRDQADAVRSWISDGRFTDRERYLAANEVLHNQLVAVAGSRSLLAAFQTLELRTHIADALGDSSVAHPELEAAYQHLVSGVTGTDFQEAREAILAFARIARERVGEGDARKQEDGHSDRTAAEPAAPVAPSAAEMTETVPTDASDAVAALLEAIDARSIIEIGVTQYLRDAPVDPAQQAMLAERVRRLDALVEADRFVDVARYVGENSAFHNAYVGLLHNPALSRVFGELDVPNLMMRTTSRTSPTRGEIVDEYRRWVQALLAADIEEACRAIADYTERVREILTGRSDYAKR